MRVLLADDQSEVRSALRLLLEEEPAFEVVGEAAGAAELIVEAKTESPHLILLDWELPGLSRSLCCPESVGLRLIAKLRDTCPRAKIIALSGLPEARDEAARAGVDGFISKGESADRLLATLRRLGDGFGKK